MKKFLAVLICLVICLSLAACGSSNRSLEDYAAAAKEEVSESIDSIEDAKFDILARGNSLVYSYQYTVDFGDTSALKEALDQALTSQADSFQDLLSSLKSAVPDAESIIVEYLDLNGNIITSREFK
jgi:hypothetical protein